MGDLFLACFKSDSPAFISRYERSVAQAVEQVFAASGEVVWIKGSDAKSSKADCNAWKALYFSRIWSVQCCLFVSFRLGVLYFTLRHSFMEKVRVEGDEGLGFSVPG